MKLGLICDENLKEDILDRLGAYGVTFYDNPDLYIVQAGYEKDYLPCLVFESDKMDSVIKCVDMLSDKVQSDKIIGFDEETMHISNVKDILFFEAKESNVYFTTGSKELKIKEKLYEIELRLPSDTFIRVSRSFIVNIDKVSTIAPWFNRRLIITFEGIDTTVEVSKNYVNDFKRFLGMR